MRKTAAFLLFTALFTASACFGSGMTYPLFFTQAQLKYTLNPHWNRTQYYSHWTDWPLYIDSSLKEKGIRYRGLQFPDFLRIRKNMMDCGLDGLIFWQQHHRFGWCSDILGFSARKKEKSFKIIPQLSSTFNIDKDTPPLLNSPDVFRINGKILMQCYGTYRESRLAAVRNEMVKKFGDKFIFILRKHFRQEMRVRFKNNGGRLTEKDRRTLEKEIRTALDAADGFGWWDLCAYSMGYKGKRVFDFKFYKAVMEMTGRIMQEPRYKGKLFVAEALVGHENTSRTGHIMSSEGTKLLRDTISIALKNKADIICIPEWDEQNENTSLRPTVFNGTSHTRIMRYITAKAKGKKYLPLPGDDETKPDLILSQRKIIALGECLEFELLNVPHAAKVMPFTARLVLKNIDGKVLHSFAPAAFSGKEMQEIRLSLPSEKFAGERVILVELHISCGGKSSVYSEGWAAIQIQSTWNFDYKWVKQPLRDLMDKPEIKLELAPAAEKGMFVLKSRVNAKEKLAFAEVLENYDCIYSAGTPVEESWRENEKYLVFRVGVQSLVQQKISGTVTLENTTAQWRSGVKNPVYRNYPVSLWHRGDWVRMPRKDLEKAVFNIALPGHFTGKIPVRDIMKNKSIIIGGLKGLNLALTRQLRQYFHPENLNRQKVDTTISFMPDMMDSVIQMQLISSAGKIWRSKPIVLKRFTTPLKETAVYSETQGKAVRIAVPAGMVPDLKYIFTKERGLIVPVSYGRIQWGIRGGFTDLANMRNCGGDQSGNGVPCRWGQAQKYWKDLSDLAPDILTEGKETFLRFRGDGSHLSLPQGAVPRRSGFTLTFDVRPENVQKKQYLLSNRGVLPGAFYHLWIEKGTLRGTYINQNLIVSKRDSKLQLRPGVWNSIKIIYDLNHFIFEVNGRQSPKLRAPGPGLYDTSTQIGSWAHEHFKGDIRRLRITHAL